MPISILPSGYQSQFLQECTLCGLCASLFFGGTKCCKHTGSQDWSPAWLAVRPCFVWLLWVCSWVRQAPGMTGREAYQHVTVQDAGR